MINTPPLSHQKAHNDKLQNEGGENLESPKLSWDAPQVPNIHS